MIPWRNGKLLVWDATSPDTFAPSYVSRATSEAGAVAALAEDRKKTKYTCLEPCYTFTPIGIETSGGFGPLTLQFLKDLGNGLRQATGDVNSYTYLIQRLSVSVQRGNTASVLYIYIYLYCFFCFFILGSTLRTITWLYCSVVVTLINNTKTIDEACQQN